MRFPDLVDGIVTDPTLSGAIDQLLAVKRSASESEYGSPLSIINEFIDKELTRLEAVLPPKPGGADFAVLDRLLMNSVMQSNPANTSVEVSE
ncbi:hypothetical protein CCP4SC76_5870003 [Gammaproteobacteria bacterium]